MNKFRIPSNRHQMSLLPRSVDEFVPADDIVRYIDLFVDELNLSAIEEKYSYDGRPGYAPAVMIKVLVYGKLRGIRSSRELSAAVTENLKFIFIASGERPDFRTISLFRKKFHKELAQILQQTIEVGIESGAIDLKHVAIDGTLVPGFASSNSFKSPEFIKEHLEKLEKSLEQDIESDIQDEDKDDSGPTLPKNLQSNWQLIAKLREVLKNHKREARNDQSVSITDPDCKKMRHGAAYNGQAAVDESSRMVVGAYATNLASDSGELVPVLKDVKMRIGKAPQMVTADAGYKAQVGLKYLEDEKIDGFVPQMASSSGGFGIDEFRYDKKRDEYTCPNNKKLKLIHVNPKMKNYRPESDCTGCKLLKNCMRTLSEGRHAKRRTLSVSVYAKLVDQMRIKTSSELGKAMCRRRSATVETLFAHLKYLRKFNRFCFRGLQMVNSMWCFELAAHNIERLFGFRRTLCKA